MTHELKTWPEYFDKVLTGAKTFELRKKDREFKSGDVLLLKEWKPSGYSSVSPNTMEGEYTGRELSVMVGYIFDDPTDSWSLGLQPGYCIMSIHL